MLSYRRQCPHPSTTRLKRSPPPSSSHGPSPSLPFPTPFPKPQQQLFRWERILSIFDRVLRLFLGDVRAGGSTGLTGGRSEFGPRPDPGVARHLGSRSHFLFLRQASWGAEPSAPQRRSWGEAKMAAARRDGWGGLQSRGGREDSRARGYAPPTHVSWSNLELGGYPPLV